MVTLKPLDSHHTFVYKYDVMGKYFLPDIASVTDLRYKTKSLLDRLSQQSSPVLILRDSQPAAVLVSPSLYEKFSRAHDLLEDYMDALDLEREIDRSEKGRGIKLEKYLTQRFGPNYVRNCPKKKGRKVPR